jgi:hypothetical protein
MLGMMIGSSEQPKVEPKWIEQVEHVGYVPYRPPIRVASQPVAATFEAGGAVPLKLPGTYLLYSLYYKVPHVRTAGSFYQGLVSVTPQPRDQHSTAGKQAATSDRPGSPQHSRCTIT